MDTRARKRRRRKKHLFEVAYDNIKSNVKFSSGDQPQNRNWNAMDAAMMTRRDAAKDACVSFVSGMLSTIGLISLVIGYCCLGGAVFEWLESGAEEDGVRNSRRHVEAVVKQYSADLYSTLQIALEQGSLDVVQLISTKLRQLSEEAYQISDSGSWDGAETGQPLSADWTFSGALLFSVTALTTIGYGFIAPATVTGQIICVFYAIFGIPVTMLAIANLGRWFANQVRRINKAILKLKSKGGQFDEGSVNEVPVIVSLLIMVAYIFGGAFMFSSWEENLTFIDGSYFCFITLTTIGFGDIVPGVYSGKGVWEVERTSEEQDFANGIKLIICGLYLFFGLSLLAMCLDLMKEEVAANFLWLGYKTKLMKQQSADAVIEEYISAQKGE